MTQEHVSPPEDPHELVLRQLAEGDWAVADNWLTPGEVQALYDELADLQREANLHAAGVGRGESRTLAPEIRSDLIFWIDPAALSTAQAPLWHALEELRHHLNRRFFLGLKRFEGHYAVYPPNGHYSKHVDQFRDAGHRLVSFVLYLNPTWSPEWGGALRLYRPEAPTVTGLEISPAGGRVVVFLSDRVPHEVVTTRKQRFSFVGWFRDDDQW